MAVVPYAEIYSGQVGSNRSLIATWGQPTAVSSPGNGLGNTPRPFTDANGVVVVPSAWPAGLEPGDTGQPLFCPTLTDRSVQVTGGNGSGNFMVIEGCNDGVSWVTLHDAFGNTLAILDAGAAPPATVPLGAVYQIMEETAWIRCRCGPGGISETPMQVILVGKRDF